MGNRAKEDGACKGTRRRWGRPHFSRRAQRAATVLTGLTLTVGCCLLAERYAVGGPEAVRTGAEPAEGMAVLILDYHQVLPTEEDLQKAREAGETGILLADFKEDLSWLTEMGANFVLPSDLKQAAQGLYDLPEKAVLLSFDGGYESFYTVVWPQLREQDAKGAVGVSGAACDYYSGSVGKEIATSRLSWNQLIQIDRSDAAEVASMGYSLSEQVEDWKKPAPQGQLAGLLRFFGFDGGGERLDGEGVSAFRSALPDDLAAMDEKLRENLYHEADAYIIPAGCEGAETNRILQEAGTAVSFTEGAEIEELDSPWNLISGRESLYGLIRVSRGEGRKLSEVLEGVF